MMAEQSTAKPGSSLESSTEPTPRVQAFWRDYLRTLPPDDRFNDDDYLVYSFGSSPEMADELGALVAAGRKRATSLLLWELEADEAGIFPFVGEIDLIVDGRGEPLCVIELTEVTVQPFDAVDAAFVRDYGEGDGTPAWWQREMWPYYAGLCADLGREPSKSMPVVCLRFEVLYTGRA